LSLITSEDTRISSAFGDALNKWSIETKNRLAAAGYINSVSSPKNIVTAEPEVATLEVKKGDFLILGSTSLWQRLSDEEAVSMVEKWLKEESTANRQDKLQNCSEPLTIADLWEQQATFDPFKEHDFGRLFNSSGNSNAATHLYKNAFSADKASIASHTPTEVAKESAPERYTYSLFSRMNAH
jgi:hypothetical protein